MVSASSEDLGIESELVATLLKKRGITTKKEADIFLNPDYERHLHDPLLLTDMKKAVKRILTAIEKNERIAIYADFDCDGIPAAVVLHDFFKKINYDNFEVYIPHRHNDGYGFHKEAIEKLAKKGVSLIITVDVGITANEAVEHAKTLGVDVIITDHHELGDTLPKAVAVINPKIGEYPFPNLCGAAVAYKLVQAIITTKKSYGSQTTVIVSEGWEKWLLDMVGIATIADMVPLVGENRVLAHYGLKVLRKSPRPGVASLCRKLRIKQSDITEDDIGFLIAPRINAASRMDEPELAFMLLSTSNLSEAEEVAHQLEALNRKRKTAVGAIVREARRRAGEREKSSAVFVVGSPCWKPSLLGLVANSLVDDHGGAVCVWGRDGRGYLTGSCRSDGSVNVVNMLEGAEEVLEAYGGHERASGFTVSHERVHMLSDVFNKVTQTPQQDVYAGKVEHEFDAEVSITNVSWSFLKDIVELSPFGMDNPKPVFQFQDIYVENMRLFGKDNNHTEITLRKNPNETVRAIKFFSTPDSFSRLPQPRIHVNVLATLERDTFKGSRAVALRIVDIV